MKHLLMLAIFLSAVVSADPREALETRKPPLSADQTGTMQPWWTLEIVLKDGSIQKIGFSSEAACTAAIAPSEREFGGSNGKCTKHEPPK